MSKPDSISRLLTAVQAGDAAAAAAVYTHFQERARDLARRRLGPQIQAGMGVSDVVQEALTSALSFVRQGGLRHPRQQDFEAILVTIIRRKTASAARKAQRQQALPADAPADLADKRPTPDEEAVQKEREDLARQAVWEVTEFLFRRPDAMKSKHAAVRGLVRVLGIVHGLDAEAIGELLQEVFPESQQPAKRTIQLAIEDGWEMLNERFRGEPAV